MVLPHDKNEIVYKLINTKEKDRDSILRPLAPLAPQAVMKTATPRRPPPHRKVSNFIKAKVPSCPNRII